MSLFSKNFKFLRKRKGISQTELATDLGISRSKIASYEGRGVEPKLSLLVDIAKYFNISVEDLIGTNIEEKLQSDGPGVITSFGENVGDTVVSATSDKTYLNLNDKEALEKFLKESATIVKMLEGFKVFYKIKTDGLSTNDFTLEEKRAHHDIQNVLFLIDYLLNHNKQLLTVLNNAEAA